MRTGPYIGKWISCMYRISQTYFDQMFEKFGIGSGHFSFLLCLYRQEGVTQEAISKKLYIDKATTARAMMKLESLGYVERHVDEEDRRANKVYLTEKGRAIEPEIRRCLKEWAEFVTEGLTEEEARQAYSLLERMALNAISRKAAIGGRQAP